MMLKRHIQHPFHVLVTLLPLLALLLPSTVYAGENATDEDPAFEYQGNAGWWSDFSYNPSKTTGRVVSGDFDGDRRTDVAAMYDYGGNTLRWHVWLSTGEEFDYQGSNPGWWSGAQYDPNRTTGRVVAGDFNGDGLSDVAAMYDYGGNTLHWHVWLSTGDAFAYQGSSPGWWSGAQYDPNRTTDRVVAGDFNGDGRSDVAAMYDYGGNTLRWHVWLSTGDAFAYQGSNPGWWSGAQYDPSRTTGRVVAGDFNGDGLSDVAAMYDYGGNTLHWHVWLSTGDAFAYQGSSPGWWSGSQYDPNRTTNRVVAWDFNGDGRSDVAALYDYGGNTARWHVWLSTGDSFDYQGSNPGWWSSTGYDALRTTDRVVAGDFDGDAIGDVAALYDYGSSTLRWHVWLSNAPNHVFLPGVTAD